MQARRHDPTASPDPARFARQLALPGFELASQERLEAARVLVIGAGGLGSSVLPALAAAGIGTIGIVDDDRVETSNLHRQTIHRPADVGRLKVESAADALRALSPSTTVIEHPFRFDPSSAPELAADYDLVVDGSDNFPTRYLANDTAALLGLALVWGGVSQWDGQVGSALPGRGPDYRDLFPVPPPAGSVLSCEEGGVLPAVCAIVGSIMAGEVVKLAGGVGEPLLGRVTVVDGRGGGFRELRYAADPTREPVTGLIDYDAFCGVTPGGGVDAGSGADSDSGAIAASALRGELAGGDPPLLVDVREPWEAELVALPGALLAPLGGLQTAVAALDRGRAIVVYCHHGIRSAAARERMLALGFGDVRHLDGGIDAWAVEIEPGMRRY